MRYGLLARLSDMAHGWLDGRRGIPRLPETLPVNGSAVPVPEGYAKPISLPVAGHEAAARPEWWTPRMVALSRQAGEWIEKEKAAFHRDCVSCKAELGTYRAAADRAAEEVAAAREALREAQRRLTPEERDARRLAEQDHRTRPDEFVRRRRDTGWERRLRAAEQAHQDAVARLAEATRQAQLREELIRDRLAVARAAARGCHELGMRRIATYQQQLVRTHRQGADLNLLLMTHPVGPDLPDWARGPDWAREPDAGGQPRGRHETTDTHLSDETSSP